LTPEEPNEAVDGAVEVGKAGEPGEASQEPDNENAAHPAFNDDFNLRPAYVRDCVLHYTAPEGYMFHLQSYTGLILVPIERHCGGDIVMVDAGQVDDGEANNHGEVNYGGEVNNGGEMNNGGEVNSGGTQRAAIPPLSTGVLTRSMTRRLQRQAEQQAQQQAY
jgi:hypothetical protein